MADNIKYTTSFIPTKALAQKVDNLIVMSENNRKQFERRWYDNNFFDDGFHFRYVSRETGKIVDLSQHSSSHTPMRAIPKASRQIRGVANLLLSPEYRPVVYPDENSLTNNREMAKKEAQRKGLWIQDQWETNEIKEKLIEMVIGSSKESVSFIKIWSDGKERIRTVVRDAFDLYLTGSVSDIEDSPFVIEAHPKLIAQIKSNPAFKQEDLDQINPDNKYASSEVKEAYMRSKYGNQMASDDVATLIQKEAFIKEYVNRDNMADIIKNGNKNDLEDLSLKEIGDVVMRHAFVAGGIVLLDEYLAMDKYPYIDFRFEPGPIYQVPLIERFIPANKSLDTVMSRIERYTNTMVTGTWMKRKGENFEVNNIPGGQVIEYEGTPPVQGNIVQIPSFVFNLIEQLNSIIEEQGASTAALGQIPSGVKSGVAIESLKSTEYANLKIASDQLKKTVRRIGEQMISIGSDFVVPKTIMRMDKQEPETLSFIGERGISKRKELGIQIPEDVTVLHKDVKVDIEVESGLGFTMEGKKQTMQQIATFMRDLAREGYLTQEAVKVVLDKFLETYQFGATQEFTEAMNDGTQSSKLTEDQLAQMKIAIAEVLKDLGLVGPESDQKLVDSTKVGVGEMMQDMAGGQNAT